MAGVRPRSLLVSAALHLALFLSAFIAWPFMSHPLKVLEATPVTIVARGPVNIRPASKSVRPQAATAPKPVPEPEPPAPAPPPPEPVAEPAPAPKPRPMPPRPTPPEPAPAPPPKRAPTPKPKPIPKPVPEPPPPPPKPVVKPPPKPASLDLDQLASAAPTAHARTGNLDLGALASAEPKSTRSRAAPTAQAKGPARGETDLLARLAAGRASGLSADALSALQAKLNRLWNPNCDVEGGGGVIVKVRLRLGPDGQLMGPPVLVSQNATGASPAVVDAAARRALSAARQGEPYTEIPRDGPHDITAVFDAKHACRP